MLFNDVGRITWTVLVHHSLAFVFASQADDLVSELVEAVAFLHVYRDYAPLPLRPAIAAKPLATVLASALVALRGLAVAVLALALRGRHG